MGLAPAMMSPANAVRVQKLFTSMGLISLGRSGHGPFPLTMGQQWDGPGGVHVGFEWDSPSPFKSHSPTVAHGLAIWGSADDG